MAGTIYQLKIQLNGIRPPIWRRILVSPRTDLVQLHTIIQIAMGWTDSHLHQFVVGRKRYCEPDPDFPDDSMPEAGVAIGSLLKNAKQWLTYEYDFGDGWEHRVTLEAILPARNGVGVPRCIAGRRACPPEDVGGIEGYKDFLDALQDESHPRHEEYARWAGEYFDSERCDLDEINELLSTYG